MFQNIGRSFCIALAAKLLAVSIFLIFFRSLPMHEQFTLYGKQEFVGKLSTQRPPWIVNWANFDGFDYLLISKRGYGPERVPYFPLYPLSIRWLVSLSDQLPTVIAGQIISVLSLAGAITVWMLLLARDDLLPLSVLVFAVLFTFPTSYSLTAVYNDSIFLFFASLTLYFGRTRRFFWGGLAGALATLARLNGLALAPYLFIEYFSPPRTQESWDPTQLWKAVQTRCRTFRGLFPLVGITAIPLAFAGYLVYIQNTFGDWQLLFTSMRPWGQDKMISPLQTIFRYSKILVFASPSTITYWVAVMELGFFVWYVFMVWKSWKTIRFSYWAFFSLSILIPSLTGTFQGMPRYGLHLYPLFIGTALWIRNTSHLNRLLYFLLASLLYGICLVLFTHGIFIA